MPIKVYQVFLEIWKDDQWVRDMIWMDEGDQLRWFYSKYRNEHWQYSHEIIYRKL
jgi:hypothetical protein